MKMTAKEMFEELGFKQIRNNEDWMLYESIYDDFMIYFDKEFRTYTFKCNNLPVNVDIAEHMAITKQMKELGWI